MDGVKILFIENVGNLICPFEFEIGSDIRVMIISAAEGEDKFSPLSSRTFIIGGVNLNEAMVVAIAGAVVSKPTRAQQLLESLN